MAALIGLSLAVAVALFARIVGFDRGPTFYSTVLTVIASYYVLFAIVGERHDALAVQLVCFGLFAATAVLGFRISLWFAVAGLAAHGVFDFAHQFLAADNGVPTWWPSFCLAYDLTAAAVLAIMLVVERRAASKEAMLRPVFASL